MIFVYTTLYTIRCITQIVGILHSPVKPEVELKFYFLEIFKSKSLFNLKLNKFNTLVYQFCITNVESYTT